MNFKKAVSFVLILSFVISFASCGRVSTIDYDAYSFDTLASQDGRTTSADAETTSAAVTTTTDVFRDPTFTRITVVGGGTTTTAADVTVTSVTSTKPEQSATQNDVVSESRPLLYKATKAGEDGVIYFFGSIHLSRKKENLVPEEVKSLLEECEALAVESDVVALENDLSKSIQYAQTMVYKDGTTVDKHVSKETYAAMTAFMKDNGSSGYISVYKMYDCAFWYNIIEQTMLEQLGFDFDNGVDSTLLKLAKKQKKTIIELEDPIETSEMMLGTDCDDYYALALDSIFDEEFTPDLLKEQTDMLLDAWKRGDEEAIRMLLSEDSDYTGMSEAEIKIVEEYNKKILDDRNEKMTEKAKAMISGGQKVLYVVGAAHVIGENGIVDALRADGYELELIPTSLS